MRLHRAVCVLRGAAAARMQIRCGDPRQFGGTIAVAGVPLFAHQGEQHRQRAHTGWRIRVVRRRFGHIGQRWWVTGAERSLACTVIMPSFIRISGAYGKGYFPTNAFFPAVDTGPTGAWMSIGAWRRSRRPMQASSFLLARSSFMLGQPPARAVSTPLVCTRSFTRYFMVTEAKFRRCLASFGRPQTAQRREWTGLVGVVASVLLAAAPALASPRSAPRPALHRAGAVAVTATPSRKVGRSQRAAFAHARILPPGKASLRHASLRWHGRLSPDVATEMTSAFAPAVPSDPRSGAENGPVLGRGVASWYGGRRNGRRMSDGGVFDDSLLTAAHPWLPLGTRVRVTRVGTNDSVVVTITDRQGTRKRLIDVSREAARELGFLGRGTALVTLTPG